MLRPWVAAGLVALSLVAIAGAAPGRAGDLDRSFGRAGTVVVPFPRGPTAGQALALQDDGRILVAGAFTSANGARTDFALARLSRRGTARQDVRR